jgi:putative aldouronate transport system permease protein
MKINQNSAVSPFSTVLSLKGRKKSKWFSLLDLMALPGMLYLIINNYVPMAGLFIAFKKIDFSKGILKSDWVGFKNFKFLFTTNDAFYITRNTILYNLSFILLITTIGVMVGIMLSEVRRRRLTKFYQTSILLPQLISIIIIANIVYAFLSNETGMLNKTILPMFGLDPVNFYAEPKFWPFILPVVFVWNRIGYTSVIYFAAIIGIDRELNEAAVIDGANKRQQVFSITIPLLKPTIMTLVLLQIGRIFYSDFGLFYQVPMNSGALFTATNVIDTYVYRALMQLNNISMASATGAYQSVVGFITVLLANYVVRKLDRESALL